MTDLAPSHSKSVTVRVWRFFRDGQITEDLHNSIYLNGSADAAFGRLPEYVDPVYLEGYCNKLKELPKDPTTGKIQHDSPRQHFVFGYIASAECFCICNEEF